MSPASTTRRTRPLLPKIVRDLQRVPQVSTEVAFAALGLPPDSDAGYKMSARYRTRIGKLAALGLIDMSNVKPRMNSRGEWIEIANTKRAGRLVYPTHHLIWMLYPEGVPEAQRRAS